MDCHLIGTARCCIDNRVLWFPRQSRNLNLENIHRARCDNMAVCTLTMGAQRLSYQNFLSVGESSTRYLLWRAYSMPSSLEEESSSPKLEDHSTDEKDAKELLEQPLNNDVLKALLADSERSKLLKKLSEANQQNRFLKRQLHVKEKALVNFKSELAVMDLEVQALVALAEEIAKSSIPGGSRKINGKYIQSHLHLRLEAVHKKLEEQIKDVDAAQSKEVSLFWHGMAESVQVMGSFDSWSQGEQLSAEYTGSYMKFSTTLMLRPGRYEIKFLVDGKWQLSPDLPIVGEELMKNNLLVVE